MLRCGNGMIWWGRGMIVLAIEVIPSFIMICSLIWLILKIMIIYSGYFVLTVNTRKQDLTEPNRTWLKPDLRWSRTWLKQDSFELLGNIIPINNYNYNHSNNPEVSLDPTSFFPSVSKNSDIFSPMDTFDYHLLSRGLSTSRGTQEIFVEPPVLTLE